MNTQSFTRYWNIARFVAIGIAFFVFVFLTIRGHAHGGFAPNLEVELDTRTEFDEKEEARQESERNESKTEVYTDPQGSQTVFVDGAELG
jgi:hypothetical protein